MQPAFPVSASAALELPVSVSAMWSVSASAALEFLVLASAALEPLLLVLLLKLVSESFGHFGLETLPQPGLERPNSPGQTCRP